MIEGLIIIGVGAIAIVIALFGSTILTWLGAIGTSITAMVTGVITGAATLLTSWYTWAIASDATNFYIGWLWLGAWLTFFAYAGFKIATSDKKKWMNLVGKGSNYLGAIIVLFLVLQPIAVSFGAAYLSDTTTLTAIDYNVTDQWMTTSSFKTNATGSYYENQAVTFENSTYTTIIAALALPTVAGTITQMGLGGRINSTFFATHTIVRVDIEYIYVGTGNITDVYISNGNSPYTTYKDWGTTITYAGNGTLTWTPEPFQSNQLKSVIKLDWKFKFQDTTDFPSASDYFQMSFTFYESTTLMTQEFIMLILASVITLLDTIGILYATGILEKYIM